MVINHKQRQMTTDGIEIDAYSSWAMVTMVEYFSHT